MIGNKTFITTTLPYVNSKPHMGHAFEFVLGDALSRYLRQEGTVHFNIGLDEHGTKVWEKAQELDLSVEDYISQLTGLWLDFCTRFEIEYTTFYKTSDKSHHDKVQHVWKGFVERGFIYKKAYTGRYCQGCESFKLNRDLTADGCPDHPGLELRYVDEDNYFFRLSAFKESLSTWLNCNPEFLVPNSKLTELHNLIEGTEDISVSRLKSSCPWGVPVPGDDEQTIYVWFDALLNYIFAAGYLTPDFSWDRVIQLCGPDNIRFQAIFFQAFLEAEGLRKTDRLLVHGTIMDQDGRKMSKTLGNTVDPIEQLERYGLDAVRYYCLAGLSTYHNCSWNESDLVKMYNSDVCNDWGNLLSRVLHLVDIKQVHGSTPTKDFSSVVDEQVRHIRHCWDEFNIRGALQLTNDLVKFGNKYINDNKPWEGGADYEPVLTNMYWMVGILNELYAPVFPGKCSRAVRHISDRKKCVLFDKLK